MESKKYNITRKELKALFGDRSDLKGLSALAVNWACLAACLFLISLAIPGDGLHLLFYIPLSFLMGCCLRGFDNLTHEASHQNVFKTRSMHQALEFSFAFPVFKTIADYWPFHRIHHSGHRTDKDNDPDTQQNIRWGVEGRSEPVKWYTLLWFYAGRLLVLYYVVDHVRYNVLPHLKSRTLLTRRAFFWGCVFALVALTHSWELLLYGYVIPVLFWLPFVRFVTESSKHNNVDLEDDFGNSRNNIGWIHQWLLHPHGDGFHQLHHFASCIPFYNLKKAYRYVMQDPEVRKRMIISYGPLQTIMQSFKLQK
jgi:fatty acid desaturase